MGVDSYLEIYTTYLGWLMFNNIWEFMTDLHLPEAALLFILWKTWSETELQSHELRPAALEFLKIIQWRVIFFVGAVLVFAVPSISFMPKLVQWLPSNDKLKHEVVHMHSTGTTYDRGQIAQLAQTTDVKVPLGWALTTALATGSAHGLRAKLPDVEDLRAIQVKASLINVRDIETQNELRFFIEDCWLGSRGQMQSYMNRHGVPDDVKAALEQFGRNDLDHVNSRFFMTVPGFYSPCMNEWNTPGPAWCGVRSRDSLRADHKMPQWVGHESQTGGHLKFTGMPSCYDWWNDSTRGLKHKLLKEAREQGLHASSVLGPGQAFGTNRQETADRMVIRALLAKQTQNLIHNNMAYQNTAATDQDGFWASIYRAGAYTLKQSAAFVGTGTASLTHAAEMHVMLMALPMIQALVLMGIYILLPFVLLFSGFRLSVIFLAAMVIFGIKMWTFFWAIAWWVDQSLIEVMYPGTSFFDFVNGGGAGTKRMILDGLTTGMYVGLPFLFTLMMGWVGWSGMQQMQKDGFGLQDGANSADGSASEAGGQVDKKTRRLQSAGEKKIGLG